MILRISSLVWVITVSCTEVPFNRIEQQSLEVDHRGDHISNEFQLINHLNMYERKKGEHFIKSVSPLIISNNEIVQLEYSANKPEEADWIGAYSPANVDVTKTVPVKYALCKKDPNYLQNGSGVLLFNFTNLRDDVAFHYFTGSLVSPILVATYQRNVSFLNKNEPLRPRIVPVGSNQRGFYKLLWSSASSNKPTVKWGEKSKQLTTHVIATSEVIARDKMCGKPANSTGWRELGLIHTAILKDLTEYAGLPIYYTFGDADTNDYSEEMIFYVPSTKGQISPIRPTKVILYDDMGRGSMDDSFTWNEYGRPSYLTANAVGAEVDKGTVDAVYHGGDISYACGYMAVWDFFLNMIAPISSKVIYLTTVGNHESDYPNTASYYSGTDSGGECGVLATTLLPQPYPATKDKPWWSYDIGLIHFIGMSTEHDFRIGSAQHTWLEEDMSSVDREVTPWVIFGGHRAMYVNSGYGGNKSSSDESVMELLILHVEPLLYKYRVNLGFYGHNHVVQRQSAVFNKKVIQKSREVKTEKGIVHTFDNPQATVHMVIGTAGAGFTENAVIPKPEWNEMFFYKWGYARVTVYSPTELYWEWVEASSGIIFDRMSIFQVTNFKEMPHWNTSTQNNNTDDNSEIYSGIPHTNSLIMRIMNFFLFGYGFVFVVLLILFFVWWAVFMMSPSSPVSDVLSRPLWGSRRQEAYSKLQSVSTDPISSTDYETHCITGQDSDGDRGGDGENDVELTGGEREGDGR